MVKFKEILKLSRKDLDEKIKDLQLELIKARVSANKGGKVKIKETKKTIAKMLMARSRTEPEKRPEKKVEEKKKEIKQVKPKQDKKIIKSEKTKVKFPKRMEGI